MNKVLFTMLIVFLAYSVHGQTCIHRKLSKKYDFKVNLNRPTPGADDEKIVVTVDVIDKVSGKKNQEITVKPTFIFSDVFVNCNRVRSYTTGVNQNMESVDYDFGDLIVADFNFDSREDFALKTESGGNAGPSYDFYIQNADGKFSLDTFLTNQMGSFPKRIIKSNRTLVTSIHANANQQCETTYRLDENKWKRIKRRWVTY